MLRVTVKALGDYTSALEDLVDPGMPAVIGGPHGRFDLRRGTVRQVWIAAGVGVAPFLSWIRSLGDDLPFEVDFFYTAAGPIPFADEISEIAAQHPSSVASRLTFAVPVSGEPAFIASTSTGARSGANSTDACDFGMTRALPGGEV